MQGARCTQHSTAQHSTAQHSTAQHSTAQPRRGVAWRRGPAGRPPSHQQTKAGLEPHPTPPPPHPTTTTPALTHRCQLELGQVHEHLGAVGTLQLVAVHGAALGRRALQGLGGAGGGGQGGSRGARRGGERERVCACCAVPSTLEPNNGHSAAPAQPQPGYCPAQLHSPSPSQQPRIGDPPSQPAPPARLTSGDSTVAMVGFCAMADTKRLYRMRAVSYSVLSSCEGGGVGVGGEEAQQGVECECVCVCVCV